MSGQTRCGRLLISMAVGLFTLGLLAGCTPKLAPTGTTHPADQPAGPLSMTDPCPTRLHDLCGPLLLYYATHKQLPRTLDELRTVPGFEHVVQTSCPVSGKPYLYSPDGVREIANAVVIVADPVASHSGKRWTICVPDTTSDALVTKIVAIPEPQFSPAGNPR